MEIPKFLKFHYIYKLYSIYYENYNIRQLQNSTSSSHTRGPQQRGNKPPTTRKRKGTTWKGDHAPRDDTQDNTGPNTGQGEEHKTDQNSKHRARAHTDTHTQHNTPTNTTNL